MKVNLSLRITGKREDGYHGIETVFQSLDWGDEICFEEKKDEDTIAVSGEPAPSGKENLVIRALDLMRERYEGIPFFSINLLKRTPPGTGLGAGSSNAAVTLLYTSCFIGKTPSGKVTEDTARKLGCDVPFFLRGGKAKAEGRGDILTFENEIVSGRFVVVIPSIRVSTKEAYESYDLTDEREKYKSMIFQFKSEKFYNDFEATIFKSHSKLEYYRDTLLDAGADFALMSGSGSSIYGFFGENAGYENAMMYLDKRLKGEDVKIFSSDPKAGWSSAGDLEI
ncbi:4-(cytidine 5'-diphospho)-2-C-methyl-D-erythritol kinase [candidate division WOR-3 bacterium]|nr:4-(cytidine 5'-diphospho)-2-C-methyl-D-erythritol kinase [candidate division WOR-3 bacterium]